MGEGPRALESALQAHTDRLSNCVHCGFCLPACPTYVRLGDEADSPRGRLHLMGAVVEGRLDPASDAFRVHIDRCLGCRGCETVCPSGVEYGFLLERAREVAVAARPESFVSRALLALIGSSVPFRSWMGVSRWVRGIGAAGALARVLPSRGLLGTLRLGSGMLAATRPVRLSRRIPHVEDGRSGAFEAPATAPPPGSRGRVAYLRGCVQDQLFRGVNEATARVLRANGWEVVEVSGQGCCGALHAHAGHLSQARRLAEANLRAFRDARVDWIVANAAGCGATMREYHHLFDGAPEAGGEDAHDFSTRVRDVSEILAGEGGPPRTGAPLPVRVAYDPPCHLLHGQGVRTPPLALLRSIPGVEVVLAPKADECCGGAGIYALTHPELGGRIGGDKVDALRGTGAELVATGNPGCAMQIGAGLILRGSGVRVVHPVELLDESYRRAGYYEPGAEA